MATIYIRRTSPSLCYQYIRKKKTCHYFYLRLQIRNIVSMWKATAGHQIQATNTAEDDDWETDPDFVNDVSEQEQRWGSKTIDGSGRDGGGAIE